MSKKPRDILHPINEVGEPKNTAKILCFFNNFGVSCMMMDYWALLFLLLVDVDDPPGLEPNPF